MSKTLQLMFTLGLSVCNLVYTQSEISCPVDWVVSEESQSCIRMYTEEMTWYEGRDACQTEGGDLVKVVNEKMNDFIYDLFYSVSRGDLCCAWIGLNDVDEDDNWVWLDEESEAEWTSWYPDNPGDYTDDGKCAEIKFTNFYDGEWVNHYCDSNVKVTYICEIFPIISPAVTCPIDWEVSEESQSCIRMYTQETTWYEGRDACQSEGGDLVKVVNEEMNDFIYDLFNSEYRGGLCCAWIGLNDLDEDDKWVWLDEESEAEWTSWYPGNPGDYTDDGKCVEIRFSMGYDGDWVNYDCDSSSIVTYICEIFPIISTAATTTEVRTTRIPSTVAVTTYEMTTMTTTPEVSTDEMTTRTTTPEVITDEKTTRTVTIAETNPVTTTIATTYDDTPQDLTTTHVGASISNEIPETMPDTTTASSTIKETTQTATTLHTTANAFTATTPMPENSIDATAGWMSSGSLYTYLLLAIVAVLGLILIVLTARFLQHCRFDNRLARATTVPAVRYERGADHIQFSNNVYDFPGN